MADKKFEAQLGLDNKEFKTKLKDSEGLVSKFGGSIKAVGASIAAAFSIGAIVNFGKEVINLSASFEGIKKGFDQIAYAGLLDELRAATKGTVSDMQLMSRAVQASNFQIPLKNLSQLLEFASARAVQTGQSVDYLVDSIVLGIGRKSPLILDNLGISAVRLRQLLKGPGVEMATVGDIAAAVGKIATEELGKMGGMAETTGVKIQRLSSDWTNLKIDIGGALSESKAFQASLAGITSLLENIKYTKGIKGAAAFSLFLPGTTAEWKKEIQDRQNAAKDFFKGLDIDNAKRYITLYENATDAESKFYLQLAQARMEELTQVNAGTGVKEKEIETIESLNKELEKEKLNLEKIDVADKYAIQTSLKSIKSLEDRIEKIKELNRELQVIPTLPPITGIDADVTIRPKIDKEAIKITSDYIRSEISKSGKLLPSGLAPMGDYFKPTDSGAESIKEARISLANELSELERTFIDGQYMAADMGAGLVESLAASLSGGNMDELGKNLLSGMADFLSQFGKMLITLALAEGAFVNSLKNPATWPVALAAGIAMVVAAGAIKGALSSASQNVTSGGDVGYAGAYTGGYASANNLSTQNLNIQVQGVLKGKDIYISNKRYVTELETGT